MLLVFIILYLASHSNPAIDNVSIGTAKQWRIQGGCNGFTGNPPENSAPQIY